MLKVETWRKYFSTITILHCNRYLIYLLRNDFREVLAKPCLPQPGSQAVVSKRMKSWKADNAIIVRVPWSIVSRWPNEEEGLETFHLTWTNVYGQKNNIKPNFLNVAFFILIEKYQHNYKYSRKKGTSFSFSWDLEKWVYVLKKYLK